MGHHGYYQNGYIFPFYSKPTTYMCPNQCTALLEPEFVTNEVLDLLKSVVTNGEGKDDEFETCKWIPLEAEIAIRSREWMFSFDLKSGCRHIYPMPS